MEKKLGQITRDEKSMCKLVKKGYAQIKDGEIKEFEDVCERLEKKYRVLEKDNNGE